MELKMNSRKKKRIITAVVICMIAAAAIVYYTVISSGETATQSVFKETAAARGNLTVGVTETGSVAVSSQNIQAPFNGSIAEVYVKTGQNVKKGDNILKLDVSNVENLLSGLETELAKANAKYEEAKANKATASVSAYNDYQSSLTFGEYAKTQYELTLTQLENDVKTALDSLNDAKADLLYYQTVLKTFDRDHLKLSTLENEKNALDNSLKQSQEEADDFQTAHSDDLSSYTELQKEYDQLISGLDTQNDDLSVTQMEISSYYIQYTMAQAALNNYTQTQKQQIMSSPDYIALQNALTQPGADVQKLQAQMEAMLDITATDGYKYYSDAFKEAETNYNSKLSSIDKSQESIASQNYKIQLFNAKNGTLLSELAEINSMYTGLNDKITEINEKYKDKEEEYNEYLSEFNQIYKNIADKGELTAKIS